MPVAGIFCARVQWGGIIMGRSFGENWRNALVGLGLTIAVVGGGLAVAFW
jgi:hypothetical protein